VSRNFQSSGPIIAGGKAISGRSCGSMGGPEACFIAAHDLSTGEELWRLHTIPRPGEAGDETWGNVPYEARRHVGSWITPSYDPELNLVFAGTSVTAPYTKFILGSDDPDAEHLYQTSTLAIDADTGEIVWFQQHIRDQWDLDHPFERILVDTEVAPNPEDVKWISPNVKPGEVRKVLTGIPGKTGIFYSIDRATGEFLWARETIQQNVVLDIDTSNGRATMNSDLFFTESGQTHMVCPAAYGGKDWMAGAYSPLTNAIYYPLQNLCMNATALGDEAIPEEGGMLDLAAIPAPGTDQLGTVVGINVSTGEQLWNYEQRANTMSLVTTGGGLLFGGDMNRRFRAFDQETGDILWETVLGGPVSGFPISYEVDGRQYVAVSTGSFLLAGGYLAQTPELRANTSANQLFVFALPEN
jgi:glucose dehydrogenase